MQHGVLALERFGKLFGVANVALDHPQIGVVRQPAAEKQRVVNGYLVTTRQQARRQDMTDVTGATSD